MTKSTRATRCSRKGSRQSTDMDSAADKDHKRQYNRNAQREFRRRRKEHLKNLEQAQEEQRNFEQSDEIVHLRYENGMLRRENDALRVFLYSLQSSSSSNQMMSSTMSVPPFSNTAYQYLPSPSISAMSMSGTHSSASIMSSEMMPMATLSLETPSMLAYSTNLYDPALSSQPCSTVPASGLRFMPQNSPDSSALPITQFSMGPLVPSLTVSQSEAQSQRGLSGPASHIVPVVILPYDRTKAQFEILELFRPFYSDPAVISDPQRHLAALRSLSESLPSSLKPSKTQLETPHQCGIDMIPSPSLRDRLMIVYSEVARCLVAELGVTGGDGSEVSHVTIWGDEPLNEMSWELSQQFLERWVWLLGPSWLQRANFWRRNRGAPPIPENLIQLSAVHSMEWHSMTQRDMA